MVSPTYLRPRSFLGLALLAGAACGDDGAAAPNETAGSSSSTTGYAEDSGTTAPAIECTPGEVECDGEALTRCAPTGRTWLPEPCPSKAVCQPCTDDSCTEARCVGPCDSTDELPSSAGCSFIANRQLHLHPEFNDGIVVANPNSDEQATVQLYLTPEGKNIEEPVGEAIILDPLEAHTFELGNTFVQSDSSMFRTGGTHRVQSDIPVIAYHHAPVRMASGNDSSLLFPEAALRSDYVVMSYGPNIIPTSGEPSYFEIVALQNFTTVEWVPRADTAGNGLPINFVASGERGVLKMNRFDTARIAASGMNVEDIVARDVSGTVIHADKPIWVTSGSKCSRVPIRDTELYPRGHCDPLQEMPIPLEYWGSTYVAPASPERDLAAPSTERHHWRVYAGTDGVEVRTEPEVVPPFTLDERGEYFEFSVPHGVSFVFKGSGGVFMPVQYLQSKIWDEVAPDEPSEESTPIGDPSMYQMVPVDQFLSRYVFVTALNFPHNYVQVIRPAGAADVVLNGMPIDDALFLPVGDDYEVADKEITEGSYLIESEDAFGIVQVGYSGVGIDNKCSLSGDDLDPETGLPNKACYASYAYPGGMKSEAIYIP